MSFLREYLLGDVTGTLVMAFVAEILSVFLLGYSWGATMSEPKARFVVTQRKRYLATAVATGLLLVPLLSLLVRHGWADVMASLELERYDSLGWFYTAYFWLLPIGLLFALAIFWDIRRNPVDIARKLRDGTFLRTNDKRAGVYRPVRRHENNLGEWRFVAVDLDESQLD